MTAKDWLHEYQKQLPKYKEWFPHGEKPQEGFQEAPLAYDAIWAVAFALNRSIARLDELGMSLDDFDYEKKEITDIIKSELQRVQFLGVSGEFFFFIFLIIKIFHFINPMISFEFVFFLFIFPHYRTSFDH